MITQCNPILIVSMPSVDKSYVTNVSYPQLELRWKEPGRILCFYGVYRTFTWCIITSGTQNRLIIFWNVSDGRKIKLVPYYNCMLVTPNVQVGAALAKSTMIDLIMRFSNLASLSKHASQHKPLKVFINSEDMKSLKPNDMRFFYMDRKKCQCIAVPKQNVDHEMCGVDCSTREVTVYHQLNGMKSSCSAQLVEHDHDLMDFDENAEMDFDENAKISNAPHSSNCRSGNHHSINHQNSNRHGGNRHAVKHQSSNRHGGNRHAVKRQSSNRHGGNCRSIDRQPSNRRGGNRHAIDRQNSNQHGTLLDDTGQKIVHAFKSRCRVLKKTMHCLKRPISKGQKAKERRVPESKIAQEAQAGPSVLKFSRMRTTFRVLSDHLPSDTSDSLYRRSCVTDTSGDTATGSSGQVHAPVSMLRERFLGLSSKKLPNNSSSIRRSFNDTTLLQSRTRSVDDEHALQHTDDHIILHGVHLSFSITEITHLLHAQDYSKIIQQLESTPRDISPHSLIPLLFILGVAYFKIPMHNEARECFKQCETVAKETQRDGDVMLCNAYLGDMEYAKQAYVEATSFYKRAIRHYTRGNVAIIFKLTPPTLSAVHAKLASSYRNASMMLPAIQHYKIAINEAQIDRDRLATHTSLGNLYQSMGDNLNALEEYKQSIELAKKHSDYVSLGWAYGNIGNAYLSLNKKDEALHYLQKSLDLAVEYEQTPQAIGRTNNNLGIAYQSMNDLDKAEEYYDLALSQAIYGNDIPGQARVYGNIGNVYMLRKNYERAIPHYSEVLRLSSDPSTVSTARHNRGFAYYEWAASLLSTRYIGKCTFHGPNCDVDVCLSKLPYKAIDLYRKGCEDLKEVVKHHEERLKHIKDSSSGLTLSVSLVESNSHTFHRLQDCLVNLHKYEEALVVAEQSRARTLGELILKRKGGAVSLTPPLSFDQIMNIFKRIDWPLIYFSYTGARLICWMFVSRSGQITWNTFEVPLADDQFDGKSFDYYLRYSLTEKLVERSFEMYQSIEYDISSNEEVQTLYELIGKPIVTFLQKHCGHSVAFEQVTVISDSYTGLLPLTCLLDSQTKSFLGDHYYFNMVPSFLTMGIMSECPCNRVEVQDSYNDLCIVGDPNIPPFYHNGNLFVLGRLPHAKQEAEWVAHALKVTPILGDQATKSSLLIRLMNAKVVHIATHGSISVGFLAFSSFAVHANQGLAGCKQVHGNNVLLFPEEVEKLNISPALVVLSSCDSGRGIVKADGIQGMARAFILAGAQSVLTTLWEVPDESVSVFMQFFYQYLVDGFKSSLALQKAILSVRCFAKYSQYIHWSGYQLIGRESQFSFKRTPLIDALQQKLGSTSIFPRLADIKKIEKALVNSRCPPTDIQVCIEFSLTIVTWKKI